MNTRINYMYRDASNYKVHNTAVVSGALSEAQIEEINGCLNDSEYFIPSQVGLSEERFEKWDDQDDHCWFELQSIYLTEEPPTETLRADELLSNFRAAKDNWHDSERYEELVSSMEHYVPEEETSQTAPEALRGKIVKIDGQMYELRLPNGRDNFGLPSEWDKIILSLYPAEHNPLHLGKGIFSLCSNTWDNNPLCCLCRGGSRPAERTHTYKALPSLSTGYRPILIPLDEHTLQPDADYMASWKDGTLFEMGTLYMNNEAVRLPDKPTLHGGNTPSYEKDAWLEFRDSAADPATHIRWIKADNFLVADRNLLVNISWEDLDKQGLVLDTKGPERKRPLDEIIKDALDYEFAHAKIPESIKDHVWNKIKKTLAEQGKNSFDNHSR